MTHRNMSSNQSHRFRQSDDEEEDLDALRREALKTLHPKTESSNGSQTYSRGSSPTSGGQTQNQMRPTVSQSYGGSIQVQSNTMYRNSDPMRVNSGSKSQSYFPPNHSRPPSRMITAYDGRHRRDKLEAVDPYLPQHVKPTAPAMMGGGVPPMMVPNGWMPDGPPSSMHTGLYKPYIQSSMDDPIGIGNVQLSPRSKAFVAKNQYILMRRKGVSSPYSRSPQSPGYYGSPSPPPYRPPADRWSHSPPPKLKSKSRSPVNRGNNRSPRYVRRSHSRSPANRPRSPVFRRQSLSRSPLAKSRHTSPDNHRRHVSRSPPPQMQPRRMSRSPPHQNVRHKFSPRRQNSRSPINRHSRPVSRSPTNNMNGRRRSPIQHPPRHVNKFRRSLSPHSRRLSPIQVHTGGDNRPENRGRTPPNNMHANHQIHSRRSNSPRRRSFSRSPARKFGRRSRDRGIQNATVGKRRSPFNNSARRRFDAPVNGFRNRPRKRSGSPLADRRKKNHRTRSVDRQRREDNRRPMDKFDRRVEDQARNDRNENRNWDSPPDRVLFKPASTEASVAPDWKGYEKEKVNGASGVSESPVENVPAESNTPKDPPRREHKVMEKTEKPERSERTPSKKEDFPQHHSSQHRPEERDVSSENDDDEDDEDEEDEDDDDGICLFPSDESESENEGRFKLSSKTERDNKVSTLSFAKLGESPPAMVIKELKDFANENRSRSGSRSRFNDRDNRDRDRDRDRERDRDRDRGGRRNYDKRRDGRFRKFDTNRNRDRVKGNSNSGNMSSSSSRRDRDDSYRLDDKQKGDKPMFKSTFQAVENEARSSSKGFSEKDKDLNDRKGYSSLKKTYNKDKRDSTDKEPSNEHNLQSAILSVATNSSSSSSTSPSSSAVKSISCGSNSNSNSNSNSSSTSGKKPIHLRLGAMTNTFKTSKKSSSPSSWKASSLEKV